MTPIFSVGDYGINYETTVYGADKSPFNIGANNVRVYIVRPDKSKRDLDSANGNVTISNAAGGVIQFSLTEDDTLQPGAYMIYIEIYGPTFEISTVTPLIYVVVAKNGGVA